MNILLLTAALALAVLAAGCGAQDSAPAGSPVPAAFSPTPDVSSPVPGELSPNPGGQLQPYAEGEELFAMAETEEEALELAALYGIELVSFDYGVATFHTDEDPAEVVRRGAENDWPVLEVNGLVSAFDGGQG